MKEIDWEQTLDLILSNKLYIKHFANQIGISTSTFYYQFRKKYKMRFSEFLKEKKHKRKAWNSYIPDWTVIDQMIKEGKTLKEIAGFCKVRTTTMCGVFFRNKGMYFTYYKMEIMNEKNEQNKARKTYNDIFRRNGARIGTRSDFLAKRKD